ncbi:hypothetical protein BH09PSE4_BH09PSE4_00430 [soil metagenome]
MREAGQPVLGMILPAAGQGVAEAEAMYRRGVGFISETVGLQSLNRDGYDGVVDRIAPAARRLAERGADAVMLMGTSLSFYNGLSFNARLRDQIAAESGVPALTMSDAIVAALRALGSRRVAVATAYGDEVNDQLRGYLTEEGFTVLAVRGLGISAIGGGALDRVTTDDLVTLGCAATSAEAGADVLLLSCGGLRTLDALQPLEDATGIPVVSSFPHALWAGMALLDLPRALTGYGTLLARG